MVQKPGKMYRNLAKKAYTRREYMGGVPGSKIVQFEMGNLSQEFPVETHLIVDESCQIRHTALEACPYRHKPAPDERCRQGELPHETAGIPASCAP